MKEPDKTRLLQAIDGLIQAAVEYDDAAMDYLGKVSGELFEDRPEQYRDLSPLASRAIRLRYELTELRKRLA